MKRVLIPIKCPICGTESFCEYPELVVMVGLTRWNQMALHADCHPQPWSASPEDLARIRAYLGPAWLQLDTSPATPA